MEFMGTVGATLWGNSSAYEIRSATNPLNGGAWSAVTVLGSTNTDITDILDHPDTVYVGTTNACWLVEAASETDILPELEHEEDSNTGRMTLWKGNLYIASGLGSLYEYDPTASTITNLTVGQSVTGQSDFIGMVMAMDGDQEYLYIATDNATKAELLAGRWETIDDDTDWWWHQIQEITLTATSNTVNSALIASLPTTKKMWLGCAHATDGLYYVHHPTQYGDVTGDSLYLFDTAGDLVTAWLQGDYPHILKTFYSISVRTENCNANRTITVHYRLEGETDFTELGAVDASPGETLYFNDGVLSKRIQLKFSFASNVDTSAPELIGFTLRCEARPFDLESGRISINDYGEFRTFGGAETSWEHSEFRDSDKNYYSVSVISENLSTTNYVTLTYKLDDDAVYTTHSEVFDSSPYQTIYFPENTVGKRIRLTVKPATTTGDIVAYLLDGVIRPRKRRELKMVLYVAPKQLLPEGGMDEDEVEERAAILREINKHQWPVPMKLFNDLEYPVTFSEFNEQMVSDGDNREYIFTITAREAWIEEE